MSEIMNANASSRDNEEPSLRIWDFSDNPAVMYVSTALRRIWLIDPDSIAAENLEIASGVSLSESILTSLMGKVCRSISETPLDERWNDDLWKTRTEYTLLDQPDVSESEEDKQAIHDWLFTAFRHEVYNSYNHVFWDAYHSIKSQTEHVIGEFKPPNTTVAMFTAPADKSMNIKQQFITDTFVYPVWIAPKIKITFSVDGNEKTFDPEGHTWIFSLWFRARETVTITSSSDVGSRRDGLVAVLALGTCQARPHPQLEDNTIGPLRVSNGRPWLEAGDEVNESQPESWPEADHLARAIFLKAGNSINECSFDDMDIKDEDTEPLQRRLELLDLDSKGQLDISTAVPLYASLSGNKSFRLLALEPASPEEELRTRLITVTIDSGLPYEAISYTWGDPSDKTNLHCNNTTVLIPRNLENVLKRLRHSDQSRYVWADSVCINQDDILERSEQVSIMRDIYQNANRVLVWLGTDENDQSSTAFAAVCSIVRIWRPEGDITRFSTYANLLEPMDDDGIAQVSNVVNQESWEALRALFEVTYFRRFWIIQELALGSSAVVFWGDHSISWGLVGVCAAWMMTSGWSFGDAPIDAAFNAFLIYILPLAEKSRISSFSKLDLSAVLGTTMGRFESTDARDRIYALLGMVLAGNDPSADLLLKPDYSQDLCSVYTHAARQILEHDKHLRVLSTVQHGSEIDSTYPSWVPRWDQPLAAEPIALRSEHGFYANGGELFSPSPETFSSDGQSLILNGLICRRIEDVSEELKKGNIGFHVLKKRSHVEAMTKMIHDLNDEKKQLRASWSATLEKFNLFGFSNPELQAEYLASDKGLAVNLDTQAGKYGNREVIEVIGKDRAQTDHLGEFLLYWRERVSWKMEELRHPSMEPFWELMDHQTTYMKERALCAMNTFAGRKIFLSDDGTPGLGPAATQPGDVVAVLFGGIVPFVLRPFESGSDGKTRWKLVGECFVPSLMQGEAVEEAGLLVEGTYRRDDGFLTLVPQQEVADTDPRLHREVGESNVYAFEIY